MILAKRKKMMFVNILFDKLLFATIYFLYLCNTKGNKAMFKPLPTSALVPFWVSHIYFHFKTLAL